MVKECIAIIVVMKVNEDLIHDYYHVSGVVAILKEYIQKVLSLATLCTMECAYQ